MSGLTPVQAYEIWPAGPRGGADLFPRLLIYHRLARRDLIDSGRPGGHISGHSWEYMDRSCLAQFADEGELDPFKIK